MASHHDHNDAHPLIVSLPPAYAPETAASTRRYLSDLAGFLSSPFAIDLVAQHPNLISARGGVQGEDVQSVWDWCAAVGVGLRGEQLSVCREDTLRRVCRGEVDSNTPRALRTLLSTLTTLALPRDPNEPARKLPLPPKQSPKKAHEVDRLSTLIGSFPVSDRRCANPRVVDVGAGQGYLDRALALEPWNCRVLGIDNDDGQTTGAESILGKTKEKTTTGSIEHVTAHIGSVEALSSAITSWVFSSTSDPSPCPITLVGLHACGPLTVNIIRTYLTSLNPPKSPLAISPTWTPSSLAVVGCCYNFLTRPTDLRLSSTSLAHTPPDLLTPEHLQIATRDINLGSLTANASSPLPSLSSSSSELKSSASPSSLPAKSIPSPSIQSGLTTTSDPTWLSYRLSIKKMIWWAILDATLATYGFGPAGQRRIGKLERGAFTSWQAYVESAAKRLGLDLGSIREAIEQETEAVRAKREEMIFRLEVIHSLRCLLGPVIEAHILIDRLLFIHESLPSTGTHVPSLLPLFDRTTGSLRNMVLTIHPQPSLAPINSSTASSSPSSYLPTETV